MTLPSDFGECVERLRRSTVLIGDGGKNGSGSGVILDAGGTIATNAPVGSPDDLLQSLQGRAERVMRIQFLRGDRSTVRTASVLLGSSRSRAA
jgi:hypothetical protein